MLLIFNVWVIQYLNFELISYLENLELLLTVFLKIRLPLPVFFEDWLVIVAVNHYYFAFTRLGKALHEIITFSFFNGHKDD